MAEVITIYEQQSWNNEEDYVKTDVVLHVQTVYIALKDNKNVTPGTDEDTWMPLGDFVDGGGIVNLATNLVNGISKPDGKTIEIDSNGTLTVKVIKTVDTLPQIPQANADTLYICQDGSEFKLYKLINGVFECLGGGGSGADVYEDSKDNFPDTGEAEKMYVDKTTKIVYFWDETEEKYVPMNIDEDVVINCGSI